MAMTGLVVQVTSDNRIEEAICRIEGQPFGLSRQGDGSFAGEQSVDVVGLVQFGVVVRADSGAKWAVVITKSSGGDPFLKKAHVVPDDTTVDTMSGVVPLP